MPFHLPRDARNWFKEIRKDMDLDFDIYHMCLLAGLKTGEKIDLKLQETTELVDSFPGQYRDHGREIIALFLSSELRKAGLDESDRAKVHEFIGDLIDPLSPSHLSARGLREMNRYCWGGFDVITAWFEDKPYHLEAFLPRFVQQLRS